MSEPLDAPGTGSDQPEPVAFDEVFEAELHEIADRRRYWDVDDTPHLREQLVGLALSGGGIRSATFSLGVLQGLHRIGLLRSFDYLSTVSGGGFVGGWWSAWLARRARPDVFPLGEELEPERWDNRAGGKPGVSVAEGSRSAGRDPIHHLRLFANYLTPRKGLLSGDTWRAVSVITRNVVMTWLILLPMLLAAILAAQLYFILPEGSGDEFLHRRPMNAVRPLVPPAAGAVLANPTEGRTYVEAYAQHEADRREHDALAGAHRAILSRRALWAGYPLLALFGWIVVLSYAWLLTTVRGARGWGLLVFVALVGLGMCTLGIYQAGFGPVRHAIRMGISDPLGRPQLFGWLWGLVALGLWGWACYTPGRDGAWRTEVRRNRLIRLHATLATLLAATTGALVIAGFGHEIVDYLLFDQTPRLTIQDYVTKAGGWVAVLVAVVGSLFTVFRTAPSGGSDARAAQAPTGMRRMLLALTPPAVLLVLAALIAWVAHRALVQVAQDAGDRIPPLVFAGDIGALVCLLLAAFEWRSAGSNRWRAFWLLLGVLTTWVVQTGLATFLVRFGYADHPRWMLFQAIFGLLVTTLAWVVTLGWMVDPNLLSMHAFYRARLIRAYLGASNDRREGTTHEITEAVEDDDVLLRDLKNCQRGGPYHVINATLNLVAGRDLGTAQRSAAPFIFSTRYCGTRRTTFRPTDDYMAGGLSLGTAVAASGAAASPNMGSATPTASLAMLMTLLNVRLGFWAPTPDRSNWRSPQARLWPFYMLREFLSQTNDVSSYCYLTDGGHFDNTGLYSLVERGCRSILVVDCGADPRGTFEDLGEAVRRCRIDFDAEITLDVTPLEHADTARARQHWVAGTIRYSERHARDLGWPHWDDPTVRRGTLVILKPTFTGEDEPVDVRQYARDHTVFPQQTTTDQWFDEAQFESYRKLGQRSARRAFRDAMEVCENEANRPLHPIRDAAAIFRMMRTLDGRPASEPGDLASRWRDASMRWLMRLGDRLVGR